MNKLIGIDRKLLYKKNASPKFVRILGTATAFIGIVALWWFLIVAVIGTHK